MRRGVWSISCVVSCNTLTWQLCVCVFTVHTVQYVVQNALCYTGIVVIVFLATSSVIKRVLELEAREPLHTFIYLDEAGFNLAGRNRIGQRATIDVPGQRGGNITMCAAISENGVLTHKPRLGPYNTQHLLTFLDTLYRDIIPENERGLTGDHLNKHVVVCDNVRFHHSDVVRQWFAAHDRMLVEYLPPYSPFLNPIEEFFSSWRWKVYDRHPHTQMALLVGGFATRGDTFLAALQEMIFAVM